MIATSRQCPTFDQTSAVAPWPRSTQSYRRSSAVEFLFRLPRSRNSAADERRFRSFAQRHGNCVICVWYDAEILAIGWSTGSTDRDGFNPDRLLFRDPDVAAPHSGYKLESLECRSWGLSRSRPRTITPGNRSGQATGRGDMPGTWRCPGTHPAKAATDRCGAR